MSEQRVLVLGANGQLGKALRAEFPDASFYGRKECDFSRPEQITMLPFGKYDVVINAAAYTAVDAAETSAGAQLAWSINAQAVELLAEKIFEHKLLLVHISSDYVFDGLKEDPYTEGDLPNPLNIYGQSKLAGDIAVKKLPKHYLVRTSWVIGDGNNFVRTMSKLATNGISPQVVNDQFGRLTFSTDLAAAVHHLIMNESTFGTYNFSNSGPSTNWAEIAQFIFQYMGVDAQKVSPVSSDDYYSKQLNSALRPRQSNLNISKIEATGLFVEDWRDRLSEYLEAIE